MQNLKNLFASVGRFCVYACIMVAILCLTSLNAAPKNKISTTLPTKQKQPKSSKSSRITDEEIGMLIPPEKTKTQETFSYSSRNSRRTKACPVLPAQKQALHKN